MTEIITAQHVCVQPGGGKLYPCYMVITRKNDRLQLHPLCFFAHSFLNYVSEPLCYSYIYKFHCGHFKHYRNMTGPIDLVLCVRLLVCRVGGCV